MNGPDPEEVPAKAAGRYVPPDAPPGNNAPPDNDEDEIKSIEREYRDERRERLRARLGAQGYDVDLERPEVGLALSGGGIRSATFALGVLKGLSSLKRIHWFDYLSTVSGGGYTGAFYASLFTDPAARGMNAVPEAPGGGIDPLRDLDPLGTPEGEAAIRHLRNNGRYLLPNGGGDAFRLATIGLRGWLAVQLVIGISLLAFFLVLRWVQAALVHVDAIESWEIWLAAHDWSSWVWPLQWLLGHPFGGTLLLSMLWPLAIIPLAFAVAAGWGYWLARYDTVPKSRLMRLLLGPGAIGTFLIGLFCLVFPPDGDFLHTAVRVIGGLAIAAILFYVVAEMVCALADRGSREPKKRVPREDNDAENEPSAGSREPKKRVPREEEDRVRNCLTGWTKMGLLWALSIAGLAAVDTIGQTIYAVYLQHYARSATVPLLGSALIALLIPAVRWAITKAQGIEAPAEFLRRFGHLLALLLALLLAFVLASAWATAAEFLAWRGGPVGGDSPIGLIESVKGWSVLSLLRFTGAFVAIAIAIGLSFGFLNLSSFSGFYAGRLRRAYLGASNIARRTDFADAEDQGDDITLRDYYARGRGAPLHLINVTLNETQGKDSTLVQRDRKGRPLVLSPAGHLVPASRKNRTVTSDNDRKVIPFFDASPGERRWPDADLPLSNWMAISGAALSTGLGQNTSAGLALLAGLANLRLGIWWTPPPSFWNSRWGRIALLLNPLQWVQPYLVREFLARFSGVNARRWYLTDGGHFENTGVYELVRRRVPLIVACDSGADPDYNFADVVNLIRKLRIDFNAELEFLPADRLDALLGADAPNRGIFGELSELVRRSREKSSRGPYAAIARIRMPPEAGGGEPYLGTLILLKPRLSGLEMADLLDYHRINPDFPQQTTGDQFFNEAQWESYFRLGVTITELVFAEPVRGRNAGRRAPRWSPHDLLPISVEDFPWFRREEGLATARKEEAAPAAVAAAAPAAGDMRSAVAQMGSGRLLAGAAAALGTLGIAAGAGQSLASSFTNYWSTSSRDRSVELTLNQGDRNLLGNGIDIHVDARTSEQLGDIIIKLDRLIAATTPREPVPPGTPCVCDHLAALRALLVNFSDQERISTTQLLRQVEILQTEASKQGGAITGRLGEILAELKKLGMTVENTGPRRNIRGSQ